MRKFIYDTPQIRQISTHHNSITCKLFVWRIRYMKWYLKKKNLLNFITEQFYFFNVDICFFSFSPFFAVIDCTVSEWGVWSECDVPCGTGMMSRTRSILNAPENGGKHCPSLVQKRGCQGFKCHGQRDRRVLRGMCFQQFIRIKKFLMHVVTIS